MTGIPAGTLQYTYLNEDDIDVELICFICGEPFQSPTNCKFCGNTYCQKCIDQWVRQQWSCPSCRHMGNHFERVISRVVLNQLNRLLVQCQLCQEKNIQRSNFNDHLAGKCPKQLVSCTDQCGWKGCREYLERHLIECRERRSFAWGLLQRWITVIVIVFAMILFLILNK